MYITVQTKLVLCYTFCRTLSIFILKSEFCPDGYFYEEGELHGSTLNSGILLSLDDCALECRKNSKCNSFEHNSFDNHCVLNSKPHPNSPHHKKFVFCSKKSKQIRIDN